MKWKPVYEREGIWRCPVPLPYPLPSVNSYLIKGDNGFTWIDPGQHTEEALAFWEKAFRQVGITFGNIEKIVVTHHHTDHYGLAGWAQERSGAPVWISQASFRQVQALWTGDYPLTKAWVTLFEQHGLEYEWV